MRALVPLSTGQQAAWRAETETETETETEKRRHQGISICGGRFSAV